VAEPAYPLEDVRVVDLTQYVAGPYCTQVLADLGAKVIKIERPGGGDVYRAQGPVFLGGESVSFLALNRGKHSLVLDLGDDDGRARLRELIAQADVLVENFTPGTLERFGLDYASLEADHPRLVYCSLSGFGQDGPLARQGAYDVTMQALSGIMSITGHADGPPAKIPIAALDFGSALYGVVGILAALHQRESSGRGQWVQASLLETSLAWLSMHITSLLAGGPEPRREGTRSPFFAPYEAYATADGYLVVVGTGGKDRWGAFCRAVGLEHIEHDPHFATNSDRVQNAEALRLEVEAVLREQPTAHWEERLREAGVAYAEVQTLQQMLASEQVAALGALGHVEHPTAGEVPIVRLPISFSNANATSVAPPPALDSHGGNGFP
jgi:crotonobetainyl-CoA:carnitine CoA-transferase CaiB-like acyl-CoA transferase